MQCTCTYTYFLYVVIHFRRNQEQLRKVQERQALMLKKKEAQKVQVQQKIAATDLVSVEEVKATKDTEKPLYEMPKYKDQGKKLKEDFYSATCESDEEHYWEEEKRKRDNCKDYNYHVQKEMEEAILEKKRMCSVDKLPVISSDEGHTCKYLCMYIIYNYNTVVLRWRYTRIYIQCAFA